MKTDLIAVPSFENPRVPLITRRILVLDDDADLLSLYSSILADAGYVVDTRADGEAGWGSLCTHEYNLLLTDNQMPHLTGLELVARLRAADMGLPVILSSGSRNLDQVGNSHWLGLVSVLYKPFTPTELLDAVRHAISFQPLAHDELNHHSEMPLSKWLPNNQPRFCGLNN